MAPELGTESDTECDPDSGVPLVESSVGSGSGILAASTRSISSRIPPNWNGELVDPGPAVGCVGEGVEDHAVGEDDWF